MTILADRPANPTSSGPTSGSAPGGQTPADETARPGNATAKHRNVALLSVATTTADRVTTSADIEDRLRGALRRLRLPAGLLERVAGVKERRNWGEGQTFHEAAIDAGHRAMAEAGVRPEDIGLLINTSVTRPHLEPSVAVRLHHGLGLPSSAINFDIANACLGFVNAMSVAAGMIDSGQIKYALIVDGEDADQVQLNTIERLNQGGRNRKDFMSEFASLTLGSGAAAAVLGPSDLHPEGHRIIGGVTRAATQWYDLCVGSVDGMFTDAKMLLKGGMELVMDAWNEAKAHFDWADMDRYVLHQVSDVHTNAFVKAIGVPRDKVPTTYERFGNVGPASIPITLADEVASGGIRPGDRVFLGGVGSGINTAMMELRW